MTNGCKARIRNEDLCLNSILALFGIFLYLLHSNSFKTDPTVLKFSPAIHPEVTVFVLKTKNDNLISCHTTLFLATMLRKIAVYC